VSAGVTVRWGEAGVTPQKLLELPKARQLLARLRKEAGTGYHVSSDSLCSGSQIESRWAATFRSLNVRVPSMLRCLY
jgi:hypothetical protein